MIILVLKLNKNKYELPKEFKKIKNGAQLTVGVTVELKGSEKPACVAEQVFLVYE